MPAMTPSAWIWEGIGLFGTLLFASRFLVQWYASEKKQETVIPDAFWWISLSGGMITLVYGVYKLSPAIAVSQAFGVVVYVRNLMLIQKRRNRAKPSGAAIPAPHAGVADGRAARAEAA